MSHVHAASGFHFSFEFTLNGSVLVLFRCKTHTNGTLLNRFTVTISGSLMKLNRTGPNKDVRLVESAMVLLRDCEMSWNPSCRLVSVTTPLSVFR